MSRLIAVGDIHGQYQMLVELMAKVQPDETDQLVFLGDYIDRGSASSAVLDWLISFRRRYPQSVFLRGNHEQMLLDAVAAVKHKSEVGNNFFLDFMNLQTGGLPSAVYSFVACGGLETLKSYVNTEADVNICDMLQQIPSEHLEFIQQLPFFYQLKQFFFVHAGVDPKDLTGEKNDNQAFLWERRPLWKKAKNWDKVVVHGHTPVREPYVDGLEINIDTGAGYGSCLTACNVLNGKIWQSCT
ncbi:metallophosphoesterase family protein [Malonomonas rubra]|uniref:metallophosphoesterase family protein n=1 Tax=Malonomonas rubra TaxID=57040 RepID=UPI0026EC5E0E|nr:metallophosphoesterase family protein [Malonomonas rubra]